MSTQNVRRRRCLVNILFLAVSSLSVVSGFSDGSKLAKGSAATRTLYCNRQPGRRAPLHFDPNCKGFCEPRSDFEQFYTLAISNTTYWLDVVRVNISAKPTSGKSITGFSVYAIDESGHVAGIFVEDDTDVIVGTCNDLIAITDETHAAFHKMANHSRKNISIQWQPDGYNHGRVRFIMSAIDINMFEDSFKYRSTKGYNLDLTNPFSAFSKSPSTNDLVPANLTKSSEGSNPAPVDSSVPTPQLEGGGSDGSSALKVGAGNGTSGVNGANVLDNRDMNTTKVNNVNDTDLFKMGENKLSITNDSRMDNMNDTKTVDGNNSSLFSMNGVAVGNVNDTKLYNMNDTYNVNGTDLNQGNDTNMYTINGTSMDNMNDTNLKNTKETTSPHMSETTTPNMNDTNPYSSMKTNMNDTNDTIIRNLTFMPPGKDSQTTQTDDIFKLNIQNTTQATVVGSTGSQLTQPSNKTQLNAETTPNTSDNSLNSTPLAGSIDFAGGTKVDNDGYFTTAYPANPAANKVGILAASPFDGPGINNADVLLPAVM
ncbi:unnamed protein product [Candidula unifasciata]|uniref:Reelin domain-containing protein n=1 Tax=Candidula unifasciata TaxID=100452 RepID=A0A8S3ZVB7_9EUPU|nr:unnamed protein product [Candidula unifasciata]